MEKGYSLLISLKTLLMKDYFLFNTIRLRFHKPIQIANHNKHTHNNYTFTAFVEVFLLGAFLLGALFPLLPFTPPTAFTPRDLDRITTTTTITMITTITSSTIAITGMQNPVAFCHSPSFLPSTHALYCVPT